MVILCYPASVSVWDRWRKSQGKEDKQMRKQLFRTFSSVVLVVVLLFSVASISASADYTAYVVSDGTIARTGPGTGYSIYVVLNSGTKVTVVEMNNSTGWCKVRIGANTAYIHCWSLNPEPYKITPANFTAHINTDGVAMRVAPSNSYAAIATLGKGQEVTVVEEHSSGWCGVLVNSIPGFVYGSYVTPDVYRPPTSESVNYTAYVNTNGTSFRIGPDPAFASMLSLPTGTEVNVIQHLSNGWYGVLINGIPGFIYGSYLSNGQYIDSYNITLSADSGNGFINTEGAQFRVAPNTAAPSMIALPKGTELQIVSSTSNGWYGVTVNSIPGFVYGVYVSRGSYSPEPDPKDVAVTVVAMNQAGVVNTDYVPVHSMPGSGAPVIATVNSGTPVVIMGLYSNDYYAVMVNGVLGCIYKAYIS